MTGPVVLITDSDLGDRHEDRRLLEDALSARVELADCRTEADVLAAVEALQPDAIVTQWAPITERVFEAGRGIRVVSRYGIGIDNVDASAATARGIPVKNVPHYCTEEVATHAVALAMSLWRRLPQLESELRAGRWRAADHAPEIGRLSDATLGLIGAGRIGTLVARAFAAWGTRVQVVDPVAGADPYPRVSIEELAATSDIISLHAPLLDSNHHMIDHAFIAMAARRPILVNTSRGGLVDADAVAHGLSAGLLRGAGLDVFEQEPLPRDSRLRDAPNAILTPHAAWCSDAALPDLRRGAISNIIDFFTEQGSHG